MAVNKRIEWVDFVRAVAILTVLYIHATDGIFIISSDSTLRLTLYSRIFEYASLFIGRLGVPFFLMITGYLLLDRNYDDERTYNFWVHGCKDLIVVTVIWTIIYAISLQIVTVGSPSINFVEAGNLFFSHMWYMPMIIGMYISLPFVAAGLRPFKEKTIMYGIIAFSLLAFALPFMSTLLDMQGIKNVTVQYCLGFSGGIYGIYILLGYLNKKDCFKKISSKVLWAIAIFSGVFTVAFQYYAYLRGYNFFLWYEFPFILFGSFALFELCSRIESVPCYNVFAFLSKYSFAVFLIHNLFRLPLLPYAVEYELSQPVESLILWVALIILSYAAAVIIYRIPKVGKYILYMK